IPPAMPATPRSCPPPPAHNFHQKRPDRRRTPPPHTARAKSCSPPASPLRPAHDRRRGPLAQCACAPLASWQILMSYKDKRIKRGVEIRVYHPAAACSAPPLCFNFPARLPHGHHRTVGLLGQEQ